MSPAKWMETRFRTVVWQSHLFRRPVDAADPLLLLFLSTHSFSGLAVRVESGPQRVGLPVTDTADSTGTYTGRPLSGPVDEVLPPCSRDGPSGRCLPWGVGHYCRCRILHTPTGQGGQ